MAIDQKTLTAREKILERIKSFKLFLNSYDSNPNSLALKLRFNQINVDYEEFEKLQTAIESKTDAEEAIAEVAKRIAVEDEKFLLLAKAQEILDRANRDASIHQSTSNSRETTPAPISGHFESTSVPINLPKIELPKFSGTYETWPAFADSFRSSIHNRPGISDAQKLNYLKSCLIGKAADKVESLSTTDANYTVAWKLLEKSFDDPNALLIKHVKAFFELPSCNKANAQSIGDLSDLARKHYRALEAMQKPFLEIFPIYAIVSKLDNETRLRWKETLCDNNIPTMETLLEFLHIRQRVLEDSKTANTEKPQNSNPKKSHSQRSYAAKADAKKPICNVYKVEHFTQNCEKLVNISIDEREKLIKEHNLCFNCLRSNHLIKDCKATGCKKCSKRHHTLLHKDSSNNQASESANVKVNVACLYSSHTNQMLLSTAKINFLDCDGNSHPARVLLDSCSQANFLTKTLVEKLKLPERNINVSVTGINDTVVYYKNVVKAKFQSRIHDYTNELEFLIRDEFPDVVPSYYVHRDVLHIPCDKQLADPEYFKPDIIDGIIGAEIYLKLLRAGQQAVNEQGAVMQNTEFGWIIAGKISKKNRSKPLRCNFASIETVNHDLKRFWEIEEISGEKRLSPEEQACEDHFVKNTTRDAISGRYTVKLPFKNDVSELGNSYNSASKQFQSLERSFDKNADLKRQYFDFMHEYENLGHMTELTHPVNDGFFLPHHAIFKQSSLTTRTRVVFDASRKTSNALSLNDILMTGPVLQDDLMTIILRFRIYAYVLTADIAKMYRQILVHPYDRKYQQILWRTTRDEPVKIYQLNTITYGTTPASFLATRVLQQLSIDEGATCPRAARVLKNDFYMDDLLTGSPSLSDAKLLRDELIKLTSKGGFCLRQWASNAPELVKDLSDNNENTHVSLDLDETIKTLGVFWNPKLDNISYTVQIENKNEHVTKRSILSQIARLFDPLGLLGPVITRAKIFMQNLWQSKFDWDDSLPDDAAQYWLNFKNELSALRNFEVNRKVIVDDCCDMSIHGFADASENAYGACIFIRSVNKSGQASVQLLCAKSKVAPLKSISLPRLELCAALLLAKLYKTVKTAMRNIEFSEPVFWSDSMIVLHWLNTSPHKLKTFVSNRVAEIQNITSPEQWRHVPSADNPADLISRGLSPKELINNHLWLNGPAWLAHDANAWPQTNLHPVEIPDLKPAITFAATVQKNDLFERYSSFTELKRITAYCLRFLNNLKTKNKQYGFLTTAELKNASDRIVKITQLEVFRGEINLLSKDQVLNNNLASLSPFLDANGILRVGGRLEHSNLPYEQKHQALLPKDHYVTNLIVKGAHLLNLHAGTQATLSYIRKNYWIVDGRQYVKKLLHKCVKCRRAKPVFLQYPMGNLPRERVEFSRPFLKTGVDYYGPFFVKEKRVRNRNKVKIYVAVFVCLSTKAVHVETVEDLSTQAFLAALRRFFARRGMSSDLYSDNASNFVGAKRKINALLKFISGDKASEAISTELANRYIDWHFIPPRSPHFGGLWEAAVKSLKYHLTRSVRNVLLSIECFLTYIVEIEAILNSRPIIPLSSNPNDLHALTPGHFLIGEPLTSMPEHDIRKLPAMKLSSWEKVQQMRQHFWSRWHKEYLHSLTVKKKWHTGKTSDINVGTLVILKEDNIPPLQWPLARITKIYPGADGITRVVSVKTANSEYKRSVKNLSPLPIDI